MQCNPIPNPLTAEQKSRISGVLSVGCDRQTAVNYVGCTLFDLRRAMQADASFAADICRAEAGVELHHMSVVRKASDDVKNWRVSVWWLECRAPERDGPRGAGATARQFAAFVAILVDALAQEIHDADDRTRVIARLHRVADSVDQMLRDLQVGLPDESSFSSPASEIIGELTNPCDSEPGDDEREAEI